MPAAVVFWRRSIVDLMKLLDLDSNLSARKQLALHRRYERFGRHEHLAAQAGHEKASREWRKSSSRLAALALQ
jgi:hypothetical protein